MFEERFHIDDLIVQDKNMKDVCNPEVDSCFLTNNTYYLLNETYVGIDTFIDEITFYPRRWNKLSMNGHNYQDYRNMSRDNTMGLICYLHSIGGYNIARLWLIEILLNFSFFFNTRTTYDELKLVPDFCGPPRYSVLLRAANLGKIVTPILYLTDLCFLISICFHLLRNPNKASTVYHTLSACKLISTTQPTIFGRLATWLFINKRRGVKGYEDDNGVVSALKYYSRAAYDPPIFLVAKQAINDYNNGKWRKL